MRTPARASAFADSLRLGDTVIGLFCGRWTLMALNPSMGSDPMEVQRSNGHKQRANRSGGGMKRPTPMPEEPFIGV